MDDIEVVGTLENWHYDPFGRHIIWGMLIKDSKGRFSDDCMIHTSTIDAFQGRYPFKEGEIIETLNSFYLLGKKLSGVLQDTGSVDEVNQDVGEKSYRDGNAQGK